jgi:signal transduction histidine kinase
MTGPRDRGLLGASTQPGDRRRFRSLASRLVALGIGQMVLLAITAVVVFIAEGPHEPADPEAQLTGPVVSRLERLVDQPVALSRALDELRQERVEVSLYDEHRQLIASNVDPPLAIPQRPFRGHRPGRNRALGERPGEPRSGEPRSGEPRSAEPRTGEPRSGEPRSGEPRSGEPRSGEPRSGEPRTGEPRSGEPRSGEPRTGEPRSGEPRSGEPVSANPPPANPPPADPPPASPPPASPPPRDVGLGSATADLGRDQARSDPPPPSSGDRPPGQPGHGRSEDRGPVAGGSGGVALGERWILSRTRLVMAFHPGGAHGTRGLLVARGVHADPPGLTGPLLLLIGGFLILVIGALITARWIVQPIERLSRTARALGSGDLQARSRLDRADEIGELGHRFDEMAERISSLLVTEKELLANVAHELRTPLTRIGVALDLANEGDAEAARASLIEIAVDVSELETIVDDILTAMRFELAPGKVPAQLPLRRAVVPASEIAAAAADRLHARHAERPLEVTTTDDADIHVDPRLFRRVIDNLVENAHKYTPDTSSPIELVVARDGDQVVFEVRDRGVGISAEDLPRIFTAFFRSERSRSRETGGVGLGLTLAKRIVEAHGGTIDVTSTVNVGTSIRVSIPAAEPRGSATSAR